MAREKPSSALVSYSGMALSLPPCCPIFPFANWRAQWWLPGQSDLWVFLAAHCHAWCLSTHLHPWSLEPGDQDGGGHGGGGTGGSSSFSSCFSYMATVSPPAMMDVWVDIVHFLSQPSAKCPGGLATRNLCLLASSCSLRVLPSSPSSLTLNTWWLFLPMLMKQYPVRRMIGAGGACRGREGVSCS